MDALLNRAGTMDQAIPASGKELLADRVSYTRCTSWSRCSRPEAARPCVSAGGRRGAAAGDRSWPVSAQRRRP